MTLAATYVLPLRWTDARPLDDLTAYLAGVGGWVDEVLVVDGSPHDRFVDHAKAWLDLPGVRILRPDPDLRGRNGKVNGVVTGLRHAGHERVVIADDDVRYDRAALARVVTLLDGADAVRPQNYFDPLPWHARLDTGRTLLNRAFGADFPGTLGVRRSTVLRAGGYDGDVLFENLELLRTVEAVGGTVVAPLDCHVRRLPPSTEHFLNQRVRQAYDDVSRPAHLAAALSVIPLVAVRGWRAGTAVAAAAAGLAEYGRRRAGGRSVFPATSSLLAPIWVAERAVCS
ncbi:MAG: glycosyltransferase, partial [Actinomycetota bacterium]|nr:glycosyltransferase [Actinomycetota bacterium]